MTAEQAYAERLKAVRGYRRWTPQERDALRNGFELGESVEDLATDFGRTEAAIKRKLYWLGLLGGEDGAES